MAIKVSRKEAFKDELEADLVFFLVPFIASLLFTFFFDVHWNFYPDRFAFPPKVFIFNSWEPYFYLPLFGGFVGFVFIKALAWAFLKEEEAAKYWKR